MGNLLCIEVLRYALEIPFGEKDGRPEITKQNLVGFSLGSGGKIEIDAVDRYGQNYTIRRIWKENNSEVLCGWENYNQGFRYKKPSCIKPIYFGQKDLSSSGEGFEKDLVDKLLGSRLDEVRKNISQQKQKVSEAVDRLLKVTNVQEQIAEASKR